MSAVSDARHLSAHDLEPILEVAAKLAAPFDLNRMLAEVSDAARRVLDAERCTVWLYDKESDELVLRLASDLKDVRLRTDKGIAGACARSRRIINVPDVYADSRFDASLDKKSGFRTRCMLTMPMVSYDDRLVGVMQVLNKRGGVFDSFDERLAAALAAQCAVALQRVRMTEALIESEMMRQELETARVVQMSSLPATMPEVPSYDLYGATRPAEETGGDTFDLTRVGERVLVVLGDATGHGIGPALAVTQMQAMLRMAFRLGSDLEQAFIQANSLLLGAMPADRFITAFIGLLDPASHSIRFHSGGQAPIFHYRAATRDFATYWPTSPPLAAVPLEALKPAVVLELQPGDILALVSDGFFEYCNNTGEPFGEARVQALIAAHANGPMKRLGDQLYEAVKAFAGNAPQEDDMTLVMVKHKGPGGRGTFKRTIEAVEDIFRFTEETFEREGLGPDLRIPVDFALEELFTNVVKYGNQTDAGVHVEITPITGGVEVTMIEDDAIRFDPTERPPVDTTLPLEQRTAGGLGIHLVSKMLDALEYQYDEGLREGRTTIRKMAAKPEGAG